MDETRILDYNDIIYQIDQQLERIGWSKDKAIAHIQFFYGCKSRMHLKDDELLEFLEFLKAYKKPSRFQLKVKRYKEQF